MTTPARCSDSHCYQISNHDYGPVIRFVPLIAGTRDQLVLRGGIQHMLTCPLDDEAPIVPAGSTVIEAHLGPSTPSGFTVLDVLSMLLEGLIGRSQHTQSGPSDIRGPLPI